MWKEFMVLIRILGLVKELADFNIIFFLNYRDDFLEGWCVSRIFLIYVVSHVLAQGALDVNVLQILDIRHILTSFLIVTHKMRALDFAWLINALILTNNF